MYSNSAAVDVGAALTDDAMGLKPAADARRMFSSSSVVRTSAVLRGRPAPAAGRLGIMVHNAVKFTSTEGRVDVDDPARVTDVQITVTDNGRGISARFSSVRLRALSPGGRLVHARRLGLGLGLSIAKHLVELHGGTIAALSAGDGQGATFIVTVPRSAPGARN